jgi:hypothetical protein
MHDGGAPTMPTAALPVLHLRGSKIVLAATNNVEYCGLSASTTAVDVSSATAHQEVPMKAKKTGEGGAVPSLNEVVSDLAPRRVALNNLDLKIVDALKRLEEKLRAHISTRVSISMEVTLEQGIEWGEMLTFGKWDGKWQLLIEAGVIGDPEDWKTQPLVTASRDKRVRVFTEGCMEKLVREAAAQLDVQIAERKEAIKIADNLVEVLESATEADE